MTSVCSRARFFGNVVGAIFQTSSLAVGAHTVTAVYSGGGNFLGSTSASISETVNPDTGGPVVGSSALSSVFGQSVTFTAMVTATSPGSGTPTGTVTFEDGANVLQANVTLSGGQATFTTSSLALGTHSITVVYSGDGNFSCSTSTGTRPDCHVQHRRHPRLERHRQGSYRHDGGHHQRLQQFRLSRRRHDDGQRHRVQQHGHAPRR